MNPIKTFLNHFCRRAPDIPPSNNDAITSSLSNPQSMSDTTEETANKAIDAIEILKAIEASQEARLLLSTLISNKDVAHESTEEKNLEDEELSSSESSLITETSTPMFTSDVSTPPKQQVQVQGHPAFLNHVRTSFWERRNNYNRENETYNFSKRNVQFL